MGGFGTSQPQREHLTRETHLVLIAKGERVVFNTVIWQVEARGTANTLHCNRIVLPEQRIIQSKMSPVLRVRNPALL